MCSINRFNERLHFNIPPANHCLHTQTDGDSTGLSHWVGQIQDHHFLAKLLSHTKGAGHIGIGEYLRKLVPT